MPDTDGNCLFVKLFKIKFLIFVVTTQHPYGHE